MSVVPVSAPDEKEAGVEKTLEPVRDPKTGAIQSFHVVKKHKMEDGTMVTSNEHKIVLAQGPPRTSALMAPTMCLSGHADHVYTVKFNKDGTMIASGSRDKMIFLWNVYGECENTMVLKGHSGPVLDLVWSRDGEQIYSGSADKTAAVFDVESGERIRKLRDHSSYVNSVCPSRHGDPLLVSGSDDCSAMVWDVRVKGAQHVFSTEYQVTAVAFSDDAQLVFSGGIDNEIRCWDIRADKLLYSLEGHQDTVTGIKLSPNGNYLLSNSMDNTLRTWDVRSYTNNAKRAVQSYDSVKHDFQMQLLKVAWSTDGARISGGSSDGFVYITDAATKRILYKLPGHAGSVNEVDFHPTEGIVASCSNDKRIFLGEVS